MLNTQSDRKLIEKRSSSEKSLEADNSQRVLPNLEGNISESKEDFVLEDDLANTHQKIDSGVAGIVGTLELHVIEAKLTRDTDTFGKMDPWV